MYVEGPTATGGYTRAPHPGPGRFQNPLRGVVNMGCPSVHYTPGEQHHINLSRRRPPGKPEGNATREEA